MLHARLQKHVRFCKTISALLAAVLLSAGCQTDQEKKIFVPGEYYKSNDSGDGLNYSAAFAEIDMKADFGKIPVEECTMEQFTLDSVPKHKSGLSWIFNVDKIPENMDVGTFSFSDPVACVTPKAECFIVDLGPTHKESQYAGRQGYVTNGKGNFMTIAFMHEGFWWKITYSNMQKFYCCAKKYRPDYVNAAQEWGFATHILLKPVINVPLAKTVIGYAGDTGYGQQRIGSKDLYYASISVERGIEKNVPNLEDTSFQQARLSELYGVAEQ